MFPKVVTNLPAGTVRGSQQVIDRLRVPQVSEREQATGVLSAEN